MEQQLQKTKQFYQNGQYRQCKSLLLNILQSNPSNTNLLTKLADIHVQLNEFNDAIKCYESLLILNPNQPSIVIKLANVFSDKLHDLHRAASVYSNFLQSNNNNSNSHTSKQLDKLYFYYAKLIQQLNNCDKAKYYYSMALKIDNNKACVHYQLGTLLFNTSLSLNHSQQQQQQQQTALYHLKTATKLQPKVVKYHQEYAQRLKNVGNLNAADFEYKIALELSEYQDAILLFEYSRFLIDDARNENGNASFYYLELAYNLVQYDNNNNYDYIKKQYELQNQNKIPIPKVNKQINTQQINTENTQKIKLIIFGFEHVLTYWHLSKWIDDNISILLYSLRTNQVIDIFGGNDRINRLYTHFERISSNNIKIAIISATEKNIIIEALKRVDLYSYFDNNENTSIIHCKNVLPEIFALQKKYKLHSKEILFVDNNVENINIVSQKYETIHIKSHLLNGLTLNNFHQIESRLHILPNTKIPIIYNDDFPYPVPESLISYNERIYYGIKNELQSMSFGETIESLSVTKWIKNNWNNNQYQDAYIDFAYKYKDICVGQRVKDAWIPCNIIPQLLKLAPNDHDICRRYAKALSYLGHVEEAEKYYKKALKLRPSSYSSIVGYGWFLFKHEKYAEAEQYFRKAMDLDHKKGKHNINRECLLGYARILARLEQTEKSEYYYKMSIGRIEKERGIHDAAYYYYGCFLSRLKRHKEAKKCFQVCTKSDPQSSMNHWRLANVAWKLKDYKLHKKELKMSLDLDRYLPNARSDWMRYYGVEYPDTGNGAYKENNYDNKQELEMKTGTDSNVENNCYNIEFDRFWFDELSIVTERFNGYYDKICQFKMNDIRNILFDKKIEHKLKGKVGVVHLEDMQMIMNEVNHLKQQFDEFQGWLKQRKIDKKLVNVFKSNAIFGWDSFEYHIQTGEDLKKMIINAGVKDDNNMHEILKNFWKLKKKTRGNTNSKRHRYNITLK